MLGRSLLLDEEEEGRRALLGDGCILTGRGSKFFRVFPIPN